MIAFLLNLLQPFLLERASVDQSARPVPGVLTRNALALHRGHLLDEHVIAIGQVVELGTVLLLRFLIEALTAPI